MSTTITGEEKRVGKVRADQLGPRRSIGARLLTRVPRWVAYIVLDIAFRIPFTVFLMRAYMLGLPYELEEAAYIDGASHWQVFWQVIVPLSRPIMLSAALLQAFFSWNEFLFALTFIQDASLKTLPVGLLDMQSRLLWKVSCRDDYGGKGDDCRSDTIRMATIPLFPVDMIGAAV